MVQLIFITGVGFRDIKKLQGNSHSVFDTRTKLQFFFVKGDFPESFKILGIIKHYIY